MCYESKKNSNVKEWGEVAPYLAEKEDVKNSPKDISKLKPEE